MTNLMAELNEGPPLTRVWQNKFALTTVFRVGAAGMMRTGKKTHVVITEVITAIVEGEYTGRFKVGMIFSSHPACNGRGQFNSPNYYPDDTEITCKFCK